MLKSWLLLFTQVKMPVKYIGSLLFRYLWYNLISWQLNIYVSFKSFSFLKRGFTFLNLRLRPEIPYSREIWVELVITNKLEGLNDPERDGDASNGLHVDHCCFARASPLSKVSSVLRIPNARDTRYDFGSTSWMRHVVCDFRSTKIR